MKGIERVDGAGGGSGGAYGDPLQLAQSGERTLLHLQRAIVRMTSNDLVGH